jgi:hypothetical protein
MESTGWVLQDWLSKPGLARHMGYADLRWFCCFDYCLLLWLLQ